ncbi:MAG: transglycosylase domain-containing protein [Cytophagaceae bacterium]|jgi:penicillin-binding protein 1A|nr:transglycosylase domain-containing protein [Cytophagaceae bacterium]
MWTPRRWIKIGWYTAILSFLFLLLVILAIGFNWFGLFGETPGFEVLENPKSELASEVYSTDGILLGKYYHHFNRTPVSYDQLPKHVIDALIATEDSRFYDHSGVDAKGIFAIVPSLLMGQKRGSSTLTQQLAKNLFQLRQDEEYKGPIDHVFVHKIKEWWVAIRIERAYTKNEILLMYLNTVDFGHRSYGIKSAAKRYFNKPLDQLKLEEAAMLIGLLKGPSVYDPRRNKEKAKNRRNTVLGQMLKYQYLDKATHDTLCAKPLVLQYTNDDESSGLAAHFRANIKPFLKKWCREHGKKLYEDGLKIYVSIDSRMQRAAEEAMRQHMSYLQSAFFKHWKGRAPWTDEDHNEISGFIEKYIRRSSHYQELIEEYGDEEEAMKIMNTPVPMRVFSWNGERDTMMSPVDSIKYMMHFLHTGFVSMNPYNGHIKAWVGDIDFKYFRYDHVKQGARQPGSTFKPLLYSYAMKELGYTPDYNVADIQYSVVLSDGKVWTPKNSNGNYSNELLTLRQALAKSVNSVSAFLLKQLVEKNRPIDSLVSFAQRMGITSPLDPVPTLCLGTSDVTVLELVNAYSVFVNGGFRAEPMSVLRIEDRYGNLLEEFKEQEYPIIDEQTAYYMVELLKGSVEEGGGTSTALRTKFQLPGEYGGKTGTTQNNADGWFIGISPMLVSGAWVGGEDRSIRFRTMEFGQGARLALPVVGGYLKKVLNDPTIEDKQFLFKKPDGMMNADSLVSDTLELPEQDANEPPRD